MSEFYAVYRNDGWGAAAYDSGMMVAVLLTKRGRRLYRLQRVLSEPVFGQVKEEQGFRRFMRRGPRAASSESFLIGTTHPD